MDQNKLIDLAWKARENAYVPYSHFKVGACIALKDGTFVQGCNIENAAYGSTMCAERNAVFGAYCKGYRKEDIIGLAIVADCSPIASPCGACRQVLSELVDLEMPIFLANKEKVEKLKYLDYEDYIINTYQKVDERLIRSNIISNENYTIGINQKGAGVSKYKDLYINRFKVTDDYMQGIYFYVKNIKTKDIWTTNYPQNDLKKVNYETSFMPDKDETKIRYGNIKSKVTITVDSNEPVEIRRLSLENIGNDEEILEISSYFEPVLSTKAQEYAHPAFNNLFLKFDYDEEKNILIKALAEIEDIYYINNEIKINIYDENSYYDNYKEKITIPFLENKNYVFDLETITQFGYFAHIGKDNFKKYGEGNFKGSLLLSLSGDINIPNLYEFELSNSFNDIIRIAGNAPKDYDIKCVFTNGFLNPPMDIESLLNISLDYNDFNNLNIKIGNGGICFISENRCIIRVSLKIIQFAKNISCKKCMPCGFGFNLCEYYLNKIILGKSDNSDLIDLKNTLNMIIKGSSCLYIRNLTNCILQTIEKFNYEFLYAIEKKITLYSFINKTDII